jgi:hypothetical protein
MKKFITSSLILLSTAMVLYVGIFALLFCTEMNGIPMIYRANRSLQWHGGDTWQRFREFDPTASYDVVIMGSSHAYRGYDPRIFASNNEQAFNLGSSGQSMSNTQLLASKYAETQEGLIIIDVFAGPFETDGFESEGDLLLNLKDDDLAWDVFWQANDLRALNILMLRGFHGADSAMYLNEEYVQGGFVQTTDSLPTQVNWNELGESFQPVAKNLDAFKAMLVSLKGQQKNVVLVAHPLPIETPRGEYTAFLKMMEETLQTNNFPFLDYTFDHKLNTTEHFYDYNHLNQAGVAHWNRRLIKDLRREGLLRE